VALPKRKKLMKLRATAIVCSLQATCICFGQPESMPRQIPLNCVASEAKSNVFVGFRSPLVAGHLSYDAGLLVFPADAPVAFGFGTTENAPLDVYSLNKEYGYLVSAKSAT
jgi:hypothetical protein